mmetsp:Transcript_21040/g.27637  ORF Transcript_21040/g.27637 Transcript_21040/m.27637 type:complete len:528 (-) Transcript_21040:364-1947(-)
MAISLTSTDTRRVDNSHELFGKDKGLLVIRPGRSACKTWFTIPEGAYALVTKHGGEIPYEDGNCVWPAGIHYQPPWIKVSHLVTKQSVVFDMPVKGCKTLDNVSVEIDCAVVFRIMGDAEKGEDPSLVRKFVYEVTPRGLEQQLRDAQEEAVRALARSVKHTEVYGLRSVGTEANMVDLENNDALKDLLAGTESDGGGVLAGASKIDDEEEDDHGTFVGSHDTKDSTRAKKATKKGAGVAAGMKRSLNKQFHHQGIDIVQVIIKNVKLPVMIEDQMSNKTMIISENAQQKMNQEFEMQKLNNDEEMATLVQAQSEERDLEKQEGDKKTNDLQIQLDTLKAEGVKQKDKLLQDSRTKIQAIEADAKLQVNRLKQDQSELLAQMGAKANAEAAKLQAECEVYTETKMAEAALKVAQNEARAAEALAEAEGQIAPMLRALKEYETRKMQTEVYQSLSDNPDVVITGTSDDDVNSMLMADAILSKPSSGHVNRSQILAELAMLQNGSKIYLKQDAGSMQGGAGAAAAGAVF